MSTNVYIVDIAKTWGGSSPNREIPSSLAATSNKIDRCGPLPGSPSHVTLRTTLQSYRREVTDMHSSVPVEKPVMQSTDDRLSSLLYLSQQLNAERDLPRLLDLMAREVARLLAAERASVFLWDRSTDELWSLVALGSEPLRFDARRGVAGAVVQTGITINVPDVQQDPRFYAAIDARTGFRTRNILAVPLRNHAGEIIGAFQVLNKHQGAFTTED